MYEAARAILAPLVKQFEGCKLTPYHDAAGFPTIGWGHLLSRQAGADLAQWHAITQDEADSLLEADLVPALKYAATYSPTLVANPSKHAAIADFIYNCGSANYKGSTLRKCVDSGDFHGVIAELEKWNHAGGVVLDGLTKRRRAEQSLYAAAV